MIHQRETNPCADRIVPPYHHLQLDSPINFHHTSPKHSPNSDISVMVGLVDQLRGLLPPSGGSQHEGMPTESTRMIAHCKMGMGAYSIGCCRYGYSYMDAKNDMYIYILYNIICLEARGMGQIRVEYHKYSMVNSEYGQSCPVHIAWHWVSVRMEVIRSGLAR